MHLAYAVSGAPAHKHRFPPGVYDPESAARKSVKEALSKGFVYGYVMKGHEVLVDLVQGSPTADRIAVQASANETREERGERLSRRPLLRIETC